MLSWTRTCVGHVGEVISTDPATGDYFPEPLWFCYDCDRYKPM